VENIDEYIDKNKHYFILMHPLEYCPSPWGPLTYVSSSTREKWVECKIVDDEYVDRGKIKLRSVEEGYGSEKYYISDFISHIKSGHIVPKTEGLECVEEEWAEPLNKNYNLHHSAYTLKKVNK
jgi:hypothetical protein